VPERFAGKARFHEEAEKEFLDASHEYAIESDELADEFEAEVQRGIELILDHPEMAPVIGRKHVRGKVLHRFPYTLVYAIERGRVRLLAVAHQRRRPGYWALRVP
jgi:plasmid stabilization system protein ParE